MHCDSEKLAARCGASAHRKISLIASAVVLMSLALTGCARETHDINQSKMCIFSSDQQAKACKSGELAFFSPESWGNSQLPLNVIAAYCNTNQRIEFNKAGVICTFTKMRLWLVNPKSAQKE